MVLAALLLAGCRPSLFLHPDRDLQVPEVLARYEVYNLWVAAEDGVRVHGLDLRPAGPALGDVVFFHGNAGNLGTHLGAVLWLVDAGYRVFALDYRGFGRSEGEADVGGAHTDAAAFLAAVLSREDLAARGVAVLGQSFGAAVAIHTVANARRKELVRLLIADSPFTSYQAIVSDKTRGCLCAWPARGLLAARYEALDERFMPEKWASALTPVPLLILHGTRDAVVPVEHGRRLHEVAREPKGLWIVESAGHVRSLLSASLRGELLGVLGERLSVGGMAP